VVLIFCTENDDADNCANFRGPYFKPYYTVAGDSIKLNGVPVPRSERVFSVTHPILSRSFLIRLAVRAYKNQSNPSAKYNPSPTFAILKDMQAYLKERESLL